jgi:hypothetical protein
MRRSTTLEPNKSQGRLWLLLGFGVVIFEGGWRRSTAFGLMSGPLFPLVQGGCQHGGIRIDQPLVAAGRCQML